MEIERAGRRTRLKNCSRFLFSIRGSVTGKTPVVVTVLRVSAQTSRVVTAITTLKTTK
jgi:hypothetical protein